jgi:oligopeptidase B
VTTTHHGMSRVDEYDWLRDREDPEVVAYLEAENDYTQQRTAHLESLRETIFEEIKSRTVETDLSVPTRINGYWYYSRSFEGRNYGSSCRVAVVDHDDWTPPIPAEGLDSDQPALPGEQILLDVNALAQGHDFFALGASSISPDGTLLAYGADTVGDERYTVRVKELATGDLLSDVLTDTRGSVTWAPDGSGFYYTTMDPTWRSDKVWFHRLGDPQDADAVVFHETDERFWVGVGRSRDRRYLFIVSGSKTTTEWWVRDGLAAESAFWCFAGRREGLEYNLEPASLGGQPVLLVHHNLTGPNFALASSPMAPTEPEDWTEILAHDDQVRIEGIDAFAAHAVISRRSRGLTEILLGDLDDPAGATPVVFPHPLCTVGLGTNPECEQPVLRVGYASLAVPSSIYSLDLRDRTLTLLKQAPVLGGYNPEDYREERLWATAPDGAQVPISLLRRHDVAGTGRPAPVLLYGYGAYEHSIDPYFSIARLSLLDRGAGFAIAHVRGGGEMGRRWYDDGKLAHKQNSFSDFAACARHLIEIGVAEPTTLIAEGGSAGGLLMGAVANQAPELFAGIVADVPFVDALTSMLDASLPLTITEYDEWGNPTDDPEAYATIAAYAPYENVVEQDYPAILAETSLNDTRVLYVEPAKWVARLRAVAGERCDVLLKTEMAAGHGGVSGRYHAWRQRAFTLAWILDRMGLSLRTP